jgi:hypothetical protein
MSVDVTQHEFQQKVADSLLDDSNIIAVLPHLGNTPTAGEQIGTNAEHGESQFDNPEDYFAEALYDQEHDAQKLGDAGLRRLLEKEGQQFEEEPEELSEEEELVLSQEERILRRMEREEQREPVETQELRRQPEQRQPEQTQTPATPEQVERAVQALDNVVRENGLNDSKSANEFATALCESFGTDLYKAGVNVEALGSTMAKASLSAMQVYEAAQGDLSRIPAIPEASAKAFSYDLLRGLGIDPRAVPVDENLLANTVMQGALSFLHTYQSYGGRVTDFAKLNDGALSEQFFGNFLRAFGIKGAVDRTSAIKFADAGGQYLLNMIGKINTINARNAEAQQRQPRGKSRGGRVPARFRDAVKGSKAPQFQSNRDIFSESTLQAATSRNL